MSEVDLIPLSQVEPEDLKSLMDLEERVWLDELDWDYAPIRRILANFYDQRLLPGFVAVRARKPFAYLYFLTSRTKGMIGTVFATGPGAQQATETILSRAIECLKETRTVRRIEAQILPLGGIDLTSIFVAHGFDFFLRHYLELDLLSCNIETPGSGVSIIPWDISYAKDCAEVGYRSYRNGVDAVICADYGSVINCESYIHSLVETPGCGIFLPDSSFIALDGRRTACGFILTSQLSRSAAMIPQISIHPAHQGRGLGSSLVSQASRHLKKAGFGKVRLTVSHQNRRAYEWYLRLGFQNRRDFGAYVWKRDQE